MKVKKYLFIQCFIIWIFFPIISSSQTIQTGSWSTSTGDVKFYISQQSQLDTLSTKITFTSGNCSGSITKYSYGVTITDRSFSKDLGSSWDNSTGSITGNFSEDGGTCSGNYNYTQSPCDPISISWTATVTDPDTTGADLVDITDINFLNALIEEGVDTNGDAAISYTEAALVRSLDVSNREISDMKGLEAFINLDSLRCQDNQLTSLDVSGNNTLVFLRCNSNQITSLDVSGNTALTALYCRGNQLSSLDVSGNTALTALYCTGNQLSSLDVSSNHTLEILSCSSNQLSSLDVSNNLALGYLWCNSNQLSSLDVSNNLALGYLWCYSNPLTSLDVSNNTALYDLWCESNQLLSLDVSNNTALALLWCGDNLLTNLDVSNNLALEQLECGENWLTHLDVSNNTALNSLWCMTNQLSSLDVSKNTSLIKLWCIDNDLTSLDVSKNAGLESLLCSSNQLTRLDVSNNPSLVELWCGGNLLTSLDISINTAIGTVDSELDALNLSYMPSLHEVCVWTMPFPPSGVTIDTTSSPNVSFTTECSGSGSNGLHGSSPSRLSIYPNPVIDILTIETDYPAQYSIEITSLNGQLVFHSDKDGTLSQIDLSSFQKGIYFITIWSEDFVTTKKIIKLRN